LWEPGHTPRPESPSSHAVVHAPRSSNETPGSKRQSTGVFAEGLERPSSPALPPHNFGMEADELKEGRRKSAPSILQAAVRLQQRLFGAGQQSSDKGKGDEDRSGEVFVSAEVGFGMSGSCRLEQVLRSCLSLSCCSALLFLLPVAPCLATVGFPTQRPGSFCACTNNECRCLRCTALYYCAVWFGRPCLLLLLICCLCTVRSVQRPDPN
jgi:hypothetical protein